MKNRCTKPVHEFKHGECMVIPNLVDGGLFMVASHNGLPYLLDLGNNNLSRLDEGHEFREYPAVLVNLKVVNDN